MSPLLVSPSSATAFLSSSLGGQGDQGVRRGHGQAAREEGARRRDGQGEEKDSFLRDAKERLQCLSGSPVLLPEAPSLFLFLTSSCSLSPSPFSFLPSLTSADALPSARAISNTPSLPSNCPQNLAARKAGAVIHILATPYEAAQPITASQPHPPSCSRQSCPTNYQTAHTHTHTMHVHAQTHTEPAVLLT